MQANLKCLTVAVVLGMQLACGGEDAPLRWDEIAALKSVATGAGPASVDVTEADLDAIDFQALKDAQGTALPIR